MVKKKERGRECVRARILHGRRTHEEKKHIIVLREVER